MIIEDEPLVAMEIQDILAREGATSFEIAATEKDAVAAATANEPHIITSDVKLLEGTGPAAVAEINKRFADTRDLHHWDSRAMHAVQSAWFDRVEALYRASRDRGVSCTSAPRLAEGQYHDVADRSTATIPRIACETRSNWLNLAESRTAALGR
ncbi:MAG: response regulator [Sphingomicrobium sp.]